MISRDHDRKNNLSTERDGLMGYVAREKALSVCSNRPLRSVSLTPPVRNPILRKFRQDWWREEPQVLLGW